MKFNNKKNGNSQVEIKKDKFMSMIMTQDLMDGFWGENGLTNEIVNLHQKEYNSIMEQVKDKIIAITMVILYHIYTKESKKLGELALIIKKAKIYIKEKTGKGYEEILKLAKIN